ncbi:MAG: class I SAM-dependent methyltransferase [Chloroflexi bacterium]|nr:class I SAM-dependent methyltransferase [Chloroflexota bacterium]
MSPASGTNLATIKNLHARRLFDPIASRYDLLLEALTLFQNSRWRRFLISRLHLEPHHRVLDLCTGTAGVAVAMARTRRCSVVGVDLSVGMLVRGLQRVRAEGLEHRISLVLGNAETLSFSDGQFDAAAFTYLLRYVDDPQATISEIARVVKPGGRVSSLDFYVPPNPALRSLWHFYTRWALPLATRPVSPGWRYVGRFLGPNISSFYHRCTLEWLLAAWRGAGMVDVQARTLTFGGAVVMWGTKTR